MSKKDKKAKQVLHKMYNKKMFLVPDSIRSMAAVHCKIKDDGIAMIRISDCNNSIRIWNDFNSKDEKLELLEKLENIKIAINDFQREIIERIPDIIHLKLSSN